MQVGLHHRNLDTAVIWLTKIVSPLSMVDPLAVYKGKGWTVYRESRSDGNDLGSATYIRYVAEIEDQNMATEFALRFG